MKRLAALAGLTVYLLLAWSPLAALLVCALKATGSAGQAGVQLQLWPGMRRWHILLESVGYASTVALLATAVGAAAALYCWQRSNLLSTLCRMAALLSAVVPPYLHALAWMPWMAALPQHGSGAVTGWIAAVWVQSLAIFPFTFALVAVALAGLEVRGLEAARMVAVERRVLTGVMLPLLAPALLAAAALAFLLSIGDHAVPSLFARSTYAMEIFEEYSASHNEAQALLLALPLVALTQLALISMARWWRNLVQRPATRSRLQPLPAWQGLHMAAGLLLLPLLALAASMGRELSHPAAWTQPLGGGAADLLTTLAVGLITAFVAPLVAFAVVRSFRKNSLLWRLAAVPLGLPPALVGIGLIWFWNRDLPISVYGSFAMLPLAVLARFAPLALLVVAAWQSRMDRSLLDAARVFRSRLVSLVQVELPLMTPGLLAAGALVFALSLGELGATLPVVPPGSGTLALRLFNYLHYGASGSVAVLALCLVAANSTAVLLAVRCWNRKGWKGRR